MPEPLSVPVEAAPGSPTGAPGPGRARQLAGWKKATAWIGSRLLHTWTLTLRITIPDTPRRLLDQDPRPTLFVCWHNRLFVIAQGARLYRSSRPLHCLVSASKDGAWLTDFFGHMGLRAVRGSSSRGGREAAAELIQLLRAGQDVGITPDGPRGPVYVCKPGAITVARRGGARVILIGATFESAWRLRGWDGFFLPCPFSRVHLLAREFADEELRAADALPRLERALCELSFDGSAR